ncbi:MAG: tetratricopeptide repeat protein [Myxococcota bacterium]
MPSERPPAPGPAGGPSFSSLGGLSAGSGGGSPDGTLEAARAVLGTLTAGRAALLQLAAAHLPFDRLMALHRDAAADLSYEDTAGAVIERRLALHLRALRPEAAGHVSALAASMPTVAPTPAVVPAARPVAPAPAARPVVAPVPLPVVPAPVPLPALPAVAVTPVAAAPSPAPAAVPPTPAVAPTSTPAIAPTLSQTDASGQRRSTERMARSLLLDRSGPPVAPRRQPADPVVDTLRDLAQAAARPTPGPVVTPAVLPSVAPVVVAPVVVAPVAPVTPPPSPAIQIPADPHAPAEETFTTTETTGELPDLGTTDFTPIEFTMDEVSRAAALPPAPEPRVAAPPPEPEPTSEPAPPAEFLPSLADLLASAPPAEPDATVVAVLTIAPASLLSNDLSDWAAGALGTAPAVERGAAAKSVPAIAPPAVASPTPVVRTSERPSFLAAPTEDGNAPVDPDGLHEHSVLDFGAPPEPAPEPAPGPRLLPPELAAPRAAGRFDEETISVKAADRASLPTLREPRVSGASAARLDVRAAGRGAAPRLAGAEEEIDLPADEEPNEDEGANEIRAHSGASNLSVSFESNVAVRTQRGAPRLTEDDPDDRTNPAADLPPPVRESVVPDDNHVQKLIVEANVLARRGDFHKAIQLYTDALDMRYNLVEAHIGRGRCHLELGDYSSAMSDFARAEDHAPDRPESHVAMGDLYFARKEYKRAIEFYDQAVEIDGSHAMARCRRGISHYYRKNYRQAHQDLQRALALDPEIPNIRKYVQMAQKKLEKGE